MAFLPSTGSTVAFQGTVPWSVLGAVTSTGSVISVNQGSVATVIIGGSIAASFTPPANQSVSGAVSISNFPTNQNVGGSVVAFQGATPWVTLNTGSIITVGQGSIATVIIGGSIAASFTPPANQSVSGTVQTDVRGSVATVIIGGSIAASFTPPANQSVSGTVNVGSVLSMTGYVSPGNSISSQLSTSSVFTGAWEEVKDFSAIYITVNADTASATNGLSLQRSANATSVMTSDEYTIPAQTGKTYQIQPDARFFRVQYTNSAANQGAMSLQTVYKQSYSKPSSQRPSDAYTNETDLEQMQGFNMVFNGSTWDRMRGTTAGMNVTGSVQQGTTPWIIGSVYGNISGSVAATITNTNLNVGGSVVAFQGGAPWAVAGSVAAFQAGTQITSLVSTVPSSVIVGASIFGQLPAGTAMLGSIAAYQGSIPWTVNSIYGNISGSVVATQGTSPWVVNFQNSSIFVGFQSPSIVGSYAEDAAHATADKGLFVLGVRNDTVASFTSTNTDYSPIGVDNAGRATTKPFAPTDASIFSINSIVSAGKTASVLLFAAAGAGLRNYITDINLGNTGATTTLALIADTDSSILGRFIVPAGGGSNHAFQTPLAQTRANNAVNLELLTSASIIYIQAVGFKAP